jgi:xanthine dehydrogenase accessory factor
MNSSNLLYEEIVRLQRDGRVAALATIIQCSGSSPQKEGSKMLIRDDGSIVGTLGGGCLEAEVIDAALVAIEEETVRSVSIMLTEQNGGLVCGGKVTVFIEPLLPPPHLIILGAGHVGKALANAAKLIGFKITVIDDRSEFANREHIPSADVCIVASFGDCIHPSIVTPHTFLVIATRGHQHDLDAVVAALQTNAAYIGLLGSVRKKAVLFKKLRDRGFQDDDLGRIITPVGLPIGAVTPEEIAISIVAQIINIRRAHGKRSSSDRACSRPVKADGMPETAASS